MSKQSTLLNFFSKSPNIQKKLEPEQKKCNSTTTSPASQVKEKKSVTKTPKTPANKENIKNGLSSGKTKRARKRIITEDSDEEKEDSEDEISPGKKLKDIGIDSEDSGDEFVPGADETVSSSDLEDDASADEPEPLSESDEETPVKGRKRKRESLGSSNPSKKRISSAPSITPAKEKLKAFSSNPSFESQADNVSNENWSFMKYDFLKPDKIRDAKRRRPTDPMYDPRTLYVPDEFLKGLTPAMRQWWEMKSKNYDCVLFFKLGKFYEFYHMDAVTGVKELNLTFMKGDYAHCGFPEISFTRFSDILVDKGYKVARVEQMETPDGMNERLKKMNKTTKFDKVVKREICQIITKGTRVYSVVDGQYKEAESKYLLAICEKELDQLNSKSVYGVCFIDTSIGTFHLGQFEDDLHCSRLRTLVAMYPPVQILLERNRLSKRTQNLLKFSMSAVQKETLASGSEFLSANDALTQLAEKKYFQQGELPLELKQIVGEEDSLSLTASESSELAVKSLGAVLWFLIRCQLDYQLFSLGQFQLYTPVDLYSSQPHSSQIFSNRLMVLDAVTLVNLNITENNSGTKEGTLLNKLDHCCTPFGKRLLHQWICSPLTSVESIEARQKALTVLKDNPEVIKEARSKLIKLPDLEKLIFSIHSQSSKGLPESHPDNRAILFEEKVYSKKKITQFISVLKGFQTMQEVVVLFQDSKLGEESGVVAQCTGFENSEPKGNFPDLSSHLKFFRNAFDHEQAEKDGKIIPKPGVDAEYDQALEALDNNEHDLKQYLKKQCEHFGSKVTYVGTAKNRYQLEVSESAAKKAGDGYDAVGQRKGFKRFSTDKTRELLKKQLDAEDIKSNLLQNLCNRIFSKFSDRFNDWHNAIECIAVIDVLMSFAEYYLKQDCDMCIPAVKNPNSDQKPYIHLRDGRYPCVVGDENFIPNDTNVGDPSNLILLTGPNMGGKSTLMRQLGLIVVMAQMGSAVPASSLEMTAVDRIFTRIGAQDDIVSGASTFYVELSETSSILKHATQHSLVLIDELGRGTSTHDGTAIAEAVLRQLCSMDCRTIFSTHYHTLVEDFIDEKRVMLAHMACMAEKEDFSEGGEETVTFLYKLAEGACPKSYGFNAARLAGIPSHITRVGSQRAKQVEREATLRRQFRSVFTSSPKALRQIILSL